MSKDNVLVFSGSTYPAMQIISCLKDSLRFHVIAASSYPNHSEFVCDDTVINLPYVFEDDFIESFVTLVKERNIKYVIPTDDTICMILQEHEEDIPAIICCAPYETTKLCRYKKMAYAVLSGEEYIPRTYSVDKIEEINEFPIFIKPDNSQGSKGARIIDSIEVLKTIENLEEMVISEYLPGEEYTVDCFTNKEGKLLFCSPRVRTRLMNGITARGNNIPLTEEFQAVMSSMNSKIQFRGYWYAQLKRDASGKLKLLEICTRFAGTFGISKALGINLPLLTLCDFAGLPTEAIWNEYTVICDKTYIDRCDIQFDYDCIYIDYDDTITSKNGAAINPYVIAYLYQCKFKGKSIVLITRHQDTFGESLKESFDRLSLSERLFDEIKELKWNEKKEDHIPQKDKIIFIDNSFAERKAVHEHCQIPVFDVSNIDCLFDWRQ